MPSPCRNDFAAMSLVSPMRRPRNKTKMPGAWISLEPANEAASPIREVANHARLASASLHGDGQPMAGMLPELVQQPHQHLPFPRIERRQRLARDRQRIRRNLLGHLLAGAGKTYQQSPSVFGIGR